MTSMFQMGKYQVLSLIGTGGQLGHKDSSVTMKFYEHFIKDMAESPSIVVERLVNTVENTG